MVYIVVDVHVVGDSRLAKGRHEAVDLLRCRPPVETREAPVDLVVDRRELLGIAG